VKAESAMWKKIRPILIAAKLDPVRVENPIHPGTPDVNFVDGRWLELKCVPGWPARERTLLRIPHFTPQQRVWLFRRWTYAPGSTLLLLEVRAARQWLLFDGDVAAKVVGRSTTEGHRMNARAVISTSELVELPKILAESVAARARDFAEARAAVAAAEASIPVPVPRQQLSLACTGTLVHDEFTRCPVHD
jgi:hypothetical protein